MPPLAHPARLARVRGRSRPRCHPFRQCRVGGQRVQRGLARAGQCGGGRLDAIGCQRRPGVGTAGMRERETRVARLCRLEQLERPANSGRFATLQRHATRGVALPRLRVACAIADPRRRSGLRPGRGDRRGDPGRERIPVSPLGLGSPWRYRRFYRSSADDDRPVDAIHRGRRQLREAGRRVLA